MHLIHELSDQSIVLFTAINLLSSSAHILMICWLKGFIILLLYHVNISFVVSRWHSMFCIHLPLEKPTSPFIHIVWKYSITSNLMLDKSPKAESETNVIVIRCENSNFFLSWSVIFKFWKRFNTDELKSLLKLLFSLLKTFELDHIEIR